MRNLVWVILGLMIIFFGLVCPEFLLYGNLRNIVLHSAVLGLLVVGEGICLMSASFDLSIESTMGFAAVIGAWAITGPPLGSGLFLRPLLGVMLVLLVGVLIGLMNGYLVVKVGVNYWLLTFSVLLILRGLTLFWTEGQTITGLPSSYRWFGAGSLGTIPLSIIILMLTSFLGHLFMTRVSLGRDIMAVGGNPLAARTAGVNTDLARMVPFMISGTLAALAGLVESGRMNAVPTSLGQGMVFEVSAAAVIGGISLAGGRGSVTGGLGGALLLSVISTGLNLMEISPFWMDAVTGLLILIAATLDVIKIRLRTTGKTFRTMAEVRHNAG